MILGWLLIVAIILFFLLLYGIARGASANSHWEENHYREIKEANGKSRKL